MSKEFAQQEEQEIETIVNQLADEQLATTQDVEQRVQLLWEDVDLILKDFVQQCIILPTTKTPYTNQSWSTHTHGPSTNQRGREMENYDEDTTAPTLDNT